MSQRNSAPTVALERLAAAMKGSEECWEWPHARDWDGYGIIYLGKREGRGINARAHRVSWEITNRVPVPEGLQLDHLCKNPPCVNPAHLEPMTPLENVRRSSNAPRTHCQRGHEFTPENTYSRAGGGRNCRECALVRARRHHYAEATKDEEIVELEKALDEARLRSIEARNPGIDLDEVRRTREGVAK